MKFHYRRNRLYFSRLDLWALLFLLLCLGGLVFTVGYWEERSRIWQGILMGTLILCSLISAVFAILIQSRGHLNECTAEAHHMACREVSSFYQIPLTGTDIFCPLRIFPPAGRRTARRHGIGACCYTVCAVIRDSKIVFETRGISLVSTQVYRSTVRVLIEELREVSFEPESRRHGRIGRIRVIGRNGELIYSCRCLSGHPAQDFVNFVSGLIR